MHTRIGKQLQKVWNANAIITILLGIVFVSLAHLELTKVEFINKILQEIGFALIVAVIIWTTFEYATHNQAEERMQGHIQIISEEVIRGVFKKKFPEKYITEIIKSNIDHSFVRPEITINYTITDRSFTSREGHSTPYVRLNAIASYKAKNVSHEKASLRVAIGLPNPLIDEMKEDCRVTRVLINKEEIPISATQQKLVADLADDAKSVVIFELPSIWVDPGDEAELNFNYSMAKEEEDTEIFQTLYPAENIKISINDTNPKKRAVRAKSIHRCSLQEDKSSAASGTYIFTLDEYVLARQGFAIWWKNVPQLRQTGG